MFNPVIMATAGWSEAVEFRASRLLDFELGVEGSGGPVTVMTMFARLYDDPIFRARMLMCVTPQDALSDLTRTIGIYSIDGEVCPDPERLARRALIYAGRALAASADEPDTLGKMMFLTLRRRLARVMGSHDRRP